MTERSFSVFPEDTREEIAQIAVERPTQNKICEILEQTAETDLQKAAAEWSKMQMIGQEASLRRWKGTVDGTIELPQGAEPMPADQVYGNYRHFEVVRPGAYNPEFINSLPSMTRHHILPEQMLGWIDKEMAAFNLFLAKALAKMGALAEGQSLEDLKSLPAMEGGGNIRAKEPSYDARFNVACNLPTNIEGLTLSVYLGQQRILGELDSEVSEKEIGEFLNKKDV
jgi:hypothetical protein